MDSYLLQVNILLIFPLLLAALEDVHQDPLPAFFCDSYHTTSLLKENPSKVFPAKS